VSSEWEVRRDGVLELIGKARPATFRPALQIDPKAKLRIEALGGRWTYDKEWRDKRNPWWHVANPFSLLVSRFDPPGKADDSIEMLTTWHHSLGHPND